MKPSEPLRHAVQTCFRAIVRGDGDLLATVAVPDPELGLLAAQRAPEPARGELEAQIETMQMWCDELHEGRLLVTAHFRGSLHPLVAVPRAHGAHALDLRWWIAAQKPRSERDETARRFYAALLTGDLATIQRLAIDARGTELLTQNAPPSGEHGQLEHVAESMALVEIGPGDTYPSPQGVERVDERHAKAGLTVLLGLTGEGIVPFLMKRVDGEWRVSPAPWIFAVIQARGGKITPV